MKAIQIVALVLCLFCSEPSALVAGDRTQLPSPFRNASLGLTACTIDMPFALADLEPGYWAGSVESPTIAARGYVALPLSTYLSAQLSLLRPVDWVKYVGIWDKDTRQSVKLSIFGMTLKPMLPLSRRFSLYGEAGIGYQVRNGIDFGGRVVIKSFHRLTALAGGGLWYRLARCWDLDLNVSYAPPIRSQNQPYMLLAGVGLNYRLSPISPPGTSDPAGKVTEKFCYFPLNVIRLGLFHHSLFNWRASKYFTAPYIPIFWEGEVKTEQGLLLSYERNFFHTRSFLSLNWGASLSSWQSSEDACQFQAIAVFPAVKLWLLRSPGLDLYFTYSVAGPTYITRTRIDGVETGEHFTFQDYLGFGCFLGQGKRLGIDLQIVHFSNGNLFTENAGIEAPAMLGLSYAW